MSKIKAEYLWIDGNEPTSMLRSKTKVMDEGAEPPVWGFDGSKTSRDQKFAKSKEKPEILVQNSFFARFSLVGNGEMCDILPIKCL